MRTRITNILLLLLGLLLIHTVLRVVFYSLYFSEAVAGGRIAAMFFLGLWLDFASLFFINTPLLVLYFFLHPYIPSRIGNIICMSVFLLLNIPFMALNVFDLGYYDFSARRSTADLLFIAGDSVSSVVNLLVEYWYFFGLLACIIVLLVIMGRKTLGKPVKDRGWKPFALAVVFMLAGLAVSRGFLARPLMPSTPLLYFDAQFQPLVNNSTLTFLYSLVKRQEQLQPKKFYTESRLDSLFTIRRQYHHEQPFQRKNVVIFFLESFSREFLIPGHEKKAYTPFLDSLIAQSTWCNQAFANALMSNQGIVSMLGAMPSLLDEPYYYSLYSNNNFRGLGTILKEEGYSTHFFMGAGPDHFGFGKWCNMVGIDHYYSKKDFNDDRYYDGNWGIFDHHFLPFAAGELNKQQQPFMATVFNMSSHHPFNLPPDPGQRFHIPGQDKVLNSITYVDYSLRLFFDRIRNSDWYRNTIFLFAADHTCITYLHRYSMYSLYRIPVFLFDPARPVYRSIEQPVQQTDLVPTVLDYLSYSKAFMAFGRSWFDTAYNPILTVRSGVTQLFDSSFVLGYNLSADQPVYLHNYRQDSALAQNLLNDPKHTLVRERLLLYNRAVVQRYNNSLIRNQLLVK